MARSRPHQANPVPRGAPRDHDRRRDRRPAQSVHLVDVRRGESTRGGQPGRSRNTSLHSVVVAGPDNHQRRHPQRPRRVRGSQIQRRARLRRSDCRAEVRHCDRGRDAPPYGGRRLDRGDGRGHTQAQRRTAWSNQRTQGRLPRSGARHPDFRSRLHRSGRWHRPGWPIHPRGRIDVRRLHLGCRRPNLQPDRQGASHVRRAARHGAGDAGEDWNAHRIRIPALHGSSRSDEHVPGVAHRCTIYSARLHRHDEQRPALQGPCGCS